jgi:tripartite-type tricarboxylate transporter receptor subunit TctC
MDLVARSALAAFCAAAFAVPAVTAIAQEFPTRPIRLVVPFGPGSTSDILARTFGLKLGEFYRQQIVVDNRPGAGGLIGSQIIVNAVPDGHSLAMIGQAHITSALLQPKLPYRPIDDVTPIINVANTPNVVVVSPNIPAGTVLELASLIRAKPGAFNFASVGFGSASHFAAEIFNRAAKIDAVHVPFKSIVADGFPEMVAGRVHYAIPVLPAALTLTRDGKLRAIAVTSPKRSLSLPDVPTVAEQGMPAAESVTWFGIVGPANMPRRLVTRLHGDFQGILKGPDTRERFLKQGAETTPESTPESFLALMKSELARYARLIKEANFKAE